MCFARPPLPLRTIELARESCLGRDFDFGRPRLGRPDVITARGFGGHSSDLDDAIGKPVYAGNGLRVGKFHPSNRCLLDLNGLSLGHVGDDGQITDPVHGLHRGWLSED